MTNIEPPTAPPSFPTPSGEPVPPAPPSPSPAPGARSGGSLLLLAAVAVVVLVVALGLVAALVVAWTSDSGPGPVSAGESSGQNGGAAAPAASSGAAGEPTAPVTVTGDILPPMPDLNVQVTDAVNDPAFGLVAPDLIGTDAAGNEVRITADGRPKVVYFVAHWCPHCQAEVPRIQELVDQGLVPEGLDIYAVSTSIRPEGGNYPPQAWLEREGFTPPTMRDDQSMSALIAYGGGGFPFAVYLNADNRVLARSAGELGSEAMIQQWVLTAGT